MIVKDYYAEHTHIQICDDYCKKVSREEAEKVLGRITKNALQYFNVKTGSIHKGADRG